MITIMILPMCAQGQNSGKFQAKFSQIVTFCTFIDTVHKKDLDNVTFRNQPRNSLRGEEKNIFEKKIISDIIFLVLKYDVFVEKTTEINSEIATIEQFNF